MISLIDPNQTFLCDINIDNISKDENYLLIKTGNTINRLKISDIRQAIRLVMETNKHDTKDITSTMEVAEKDLTLVDEKPKKEKNHRAGLKASKAKSVNTSLDLRGERYEEAMIRLNNFIDSALLAGHGQVTIIHGHGTGVLRQGVQKALKNHPRVDSFEFAPYNMGGNGATIAKFKG